MHNAISVLNLHVGNKPIRKYSSKPLADFSKLLYPELGKGTVNFWILTRRENSKSPVAVMIIVKRTSTTERELVSDFQLKY